MAGQLPLGIGLPDGAEFATFHPGENAAALGAARAAALGGGEPVLYVHGAEGSGRSHLLGAACAAAAGAGRRAALLPLARRAELAPVMLDGWDAFDLVCIDDVDAVARDPEWEHALFALFNALRVTGGTWIAAGAAAPAAVGFSLRDLASRLAAGPVFRLQPLDDAGRAAALRLRAARRGLDLPDDVADYILKRAPRGMAALYALLESLDRASLAEQRRLTIPFVKRFL